MIENQNKLRKQTIEGNLGEGLGKKQGKVTYLLFEWKLESLADS